MGGGLAVIWGLLCCVVTMSWATAPDVVTSRTYDERGEFTAITLVSADTLSGILIIGRGMALFLVLGVLLYPWKPDRARDL